MYALKLQAAGEFRALYSFYGFRKGLCAEYPVYIYWSLWRILDDMMLGLLPFQYMEQLEKKLESSSLNHVVQNIFGADFFEVKL
ncbi:hypothetical protein [Methanosarcina sp. 1.H.A.2.2]|uniref:hypothetical protein n=1 Tax=Methanosarcina sp. 1.H.A.2.2 TaxID=1483601 RepID=UPI0006222998|nr:hypothetical protein [Methanosarcina sp. 1.H.A.2.2]KKH47200.1 hypothetical protein EO93_06165 [Methanosarcina sp. 1.H.A.2.2]